jgi:hypothetical protein
MRTLILSLFLLTILSASSQAVNYAESPLFGMRSRNDVKIFTATSLGLVANGAFKATADILDENYYYFGRVFPDANPYFWNKQLSYRNKGSGLLKRTILVWTTDGWHLMDSGHNVTMYFCITINLADWSEPTRLPTKRIILRGLWYGVMRGVGYNAVDRGFFKHY